MKNSREYKVVNLTMVDNEFFKKKDFELIVYFSTFLIKCTKRQRTSEPNLPI